MPVPQWCGRLVAAAAELAFGSTCAGCEGPSALLCRECGERLVRPARLLVGSAGLTVAAVADYADEVRRIVLAHKEGGRLGLARPLGGMLATSVAALLEGGGTVAGCGSCGDRPVALVPVPSSRSTVRRRGHDPLVRATRRAATLLRRVGHSCAVVPALRQRRRIADQAGLDAAARHANLASALVVRATAPALLRGRCVVVVDDVMTTGATMDEAARSLAAAGHAPCGGAVMALTPRKAPGLAVQAMRRPENG